MKPGDIVRRSRTEWEKETGIKVTDPAGWVSAGVGASDPISMSEFRELCATSTITVRNNVLWGAKEIKV